MPTWPASLPDFALRRGYDELLTPKVGVWSQMDSGATKRRRRFTTGPKEFTVVMPLDDAQIITFQNFVDVDIDGGVLSFDFPHPRLGTTVTVAFTSTPEAVRPEGATTYLLRLKLEVLP